MLVVPERSILLRTTMYSTHRQRYSPDFSFSLLTTTHSFNYSSHLSHDSNYCYPRRHPALIETTKIPGAFLSLRDRHYSAPPSPLALGVALWHFPWLPANAHVCNLFHHRRHDHMYMGIVEPARTPVKYLQPLPSRSE